MANRNIQLTEALDRFVDQQVESGGYENASDVVRAALRLLKTEEETHAAKLARLKAAIQVGLDDVEAGRVIEIDDLDAFFAEIEAEIEAETAKSPAE